MLDEEGFTGNTASTLGTCVHAAAEYFAVKGSTLPFKEITNYLATITDPDIDKNEILSQYPIMSAVLVDTFVANQNLTKAESEKFVWHQILEGVVVGGSIDLYNPLKAGGTITDYKTMGSLDRARVPTKFPRNYYFQQMTYAYMLREQGLPVEYCELVYISRSNVGRVGTTGKPLKDYPSSLNIVQHKVTSEDMDLIGSVLQLMAESIQLWQSNPEFRHIIAQDQRLKERPKREINWN
jgi:hypothetical protein